MGCAVSENPAFIFTHIPKTGGTSLFSNHSPVQCNLRAHCQDLKVMNGHRYLRNYAKTLDLSKYFKFAVVRNPYDRFISLWLTRIEYKTLDSFINAMKKRIFGWYALKPQFTWISIVNGPLLTDHLVRYENYIEGINEVFKTLGLPKVQIPHLRRTDRAKDYRMYYKKASQIAFVTEYYKKDLDLFNYSFKETV